tara:strand:+ start:382 stop:615 length:234 start_codon:yes stop_codon:yes gene_type:complete
LGTFLGQIKISVKKENQDVTFADAALALTTHTTRGMSLSLGRVLYRSLLRSSKRIDAQIQRHGTVDVFPEVRTRPRY